jgi:hypothetical protein
MPQDSPLPEEAASPLYPILNEINRAARTGTPFLAVSMCVALPDICVSLASPNGRNDHDGKGSDNYKAWCKQHLSGPEFSWLTPDDFYSMLCGVLHNGRFGDMKHSVARVIFLPPSDAGNTFVNCQLNDAYFYSVVEFCAAFTMAVHKWFEANRSDPNVRKNLPRLMQYREGGFPPYMMGTTVLA